jgi:hypothetical protein
LVAGSKREFPSWVGSYSAKEEAIPSGMPFQVRAGLAEPGGFWDPSEGTFIHLNPENRAIGVNTNAPNATLDVRGDVHADLDIKTDQNLHAFQGANVGYGALTSTVPNGLAVAGRVGIGTQVPATPLQIGEYNTFYSDGASSIWARNWDPNGSGSAINGSYGSSVIVGDNLGGLRFMNRPGNGVLNEIIKILPSGQVCIGTTKPSSSNLFQNWKFAVDGLINSKEVVVTPASTWADYVFEDGYQLPDLMELEKQLKAEKHLPGIPTAKEVKENGIQLGELQVELVKKIEELTLLLIEQKKEIEQLKSKLK